MIRTFVCGREKYLEPSRWRTAPSPPRRRHSTPTLGYAGPQCYRPRPPGATHSTPPPLFFPTLCWVINSLWLREWSPPPGSGQFLGVFSRSTGLVALARKQLNSRGIRVDILPVVSMGFCNRLSPFLLLFDHPHSQHTSLKWVRWPLPKLSLATSNKTRSCLHGIQTRFYIAKNIQAKQDKMRNTVGVNHTNSSTRIKDSHLATST